MMMKTIDERSILETTSSLRIIECSNSSLSSSTTSSSIGNNSDTHDQDQNDDYDDIQSPYNYNNNNGSGSSSSSSSSSFDDAIQALEKALPIRRGISTFYNGKSKSFTNLNNEWPTTPISIQDIAKPETPFTRKRRNLSNFRLPNMNTGRISKKSKGTTLHFTLEREKVNQHNFADHGALSQIKRPLPSRSFSMVNLLR